MNPAERGGKINIFSAVPDKKNGTRDDIGNWNIYDTGAETFRNSYAGKTEQR